MHYYISMSYMSHVIMYTRYSHVHFVIESGRRSSAAQRRVGTLHGRALLTSCALVVVRLWLLLSSRQLKVSMAW